MFTLCLKECHLNIVQDVSACTCGRLKLRFTTHVNVVFTVRSFRVFFQESYLVRNFILRVSVKLYVYFALSISKQSPSSVNKALIKTCKESVTWND